MRGRLLRVCAALGVLAGAAAYFATPAPAQTATTYQGQCTTVSANIDAGAHNIGTTFSVTFAPQCAWDPGTPVTVVVNGVSISGKVASSSGTITVTVTVASGTQLSIDDPVTAPGQCGGGNTIVASGSSAVAGRTVSETATFSVNCASTATPVSGGVAFTGANIARSAAVATLLVASGLGIVVVARRRRARIA